MRRRYGKTRLSVRDDRKEEINPMESVANLVDAMLVLACGLMLALIINWNVDVGGGAAEVQQDQQVDQLYSGYGEEPELDSGYLEMGRVFRDPKTGKLYMVTGDGEAAGGSGEAGTAGEAGGSHEG